jgi:hypothetical protein
MPEAAPVVIRIIMRGHIMRSERDTHNRRSPEARRPDSGRAVISIHPDVTRTGAYWARDSHRRSAKSEAYRDTRPCQHGPRE